MAGIKVQMDKYGDCQQEKTCKRGVLYNGGPGNVPVVSHPNACSIGCSQKEGQKEIKAVSLFPKPIIQ